MIRRLYWRLYDRFFDRVDEEFHIDPGAIAWIREHEPQRLRVVYGATRRNARRVLQLGCIAIGLSVWFVISAIWIPGYSSPLRWLSAGLLLGGGAMTVASSRLLAYLAYLRGERSDRPRAERREVPAR